MFAIDEVQEGHIDDLRIIVRFVHLTAGTTEPVLFLGAGLPNSPAHLHAVRTYTERWRYFRIGLVSREETIEAIQRPPRNAASRSNGRRWRGWSKKPPATPSSSRSMLRRHGFSTRATA